jgi:phosphatidylglycerol lysyltransferase
MAIPALIATWLKRATPLRPLITVLVVGTVLILAWMATRHLVNDISYDDMMTSLEATPTWAVIAALLLTAATFGTLMVSDLGGLAYTGRRLPFPLVALTSFCSYAVGNTAGFGPLTAGAIRYRFYTPHGLEPEDIARIVAFVTTAFGLGLCGVLGLSFMAASLVGVQTPFAMPAWVLQVGGGAVVLALLALGWAAGSGRTLVIAGVSLRVPGRGIMLRQFLATVGDMVLSAAVLWVLLPWGSIDLVPFIAIYSLAIGLGILSQVPAGLGVFETIIIAALGPQTDVDHVLGALVLYRVIYHLVPLAVAALLITILELRRAAGLPLVGALFRVGGRFAPPVLGALSVVVGAVVILSAVTPINAGSLSYLSHIVPLSLMETAHFAGGLLGVALVMTARGLVYRLRSAWGLALLAAIGSLLVAAPKGAFLLSGLLLVLAAGLWASRQQFSRPASLLHQAVTSGWAVALTTALITAVTLLFFVYKDVDYANRLWTEFDFAGDAPRSLRSMMGMAVIALFLTGWALLRPAAPRSARPSEADLAEAQAITAAQGRTEAVLVAMGDKHLLFSEDRHAYIMYGRQGRSWVALFDPVGPREYWPELIWRFVEMARRCGGRPAFYQVAPESLAYYADAGLRAFKLGEEARVRLADYDLKGAKHTRLRHRLNRAEKDGLELEILPAEAVIDHLPILSRVSDVWMETHNVREKRFSLGNFNPAYLVTQPVAVIRLNGTVVAFATLMLTEQTHEARIDLIRYLPEAPKGVMDILLARLMFHYKEAGYEWFILGMAPLAGLSDSEAAPIWHHVGREVFEHGEWFYNFCGLRDFKAKFQPEWQARYLAVPGGVNPMMALADITVLISGGLKGVIGK